MTVIIIYPLVEPCAQKTVSNKQPCPSGLEDGNIQYTVCTGTRIILPSLIHWNHSSIADKILRKWEYSFNLMCLFWERKRGEYGPGIFVSLSPVYVKCNYKQNQRPKWRKREIYVITFYHLILEGIINFKRRLMNFGKCSEKHDVFNRITFEWQNTTQWIYVRLFSNRWYIREFIMQTSSK